RRTSPSGQTVARSLYVGGGAERLASESVDGSGPAAGRATWGGCSREATIVDGAGDGSGDGPHEPRSTGRRTAGGRLPAADRPAGAGPRRVRGPAGLLRGHGTARLRPAHRPRFALSDRRGVGTGTGEPARGHAPVDFAGTNVTQTTA